MGRGVAKVAHFPASHSKEGRRPSPPESFWVNQLIT